MAERKGTGRDKQKIELMPWPKDMKFEDDRKEAARHQYHLRLYRSSTDKFSLTGNTADLCTAR